MIKDIKERIKELEAKKEFFLNYFNENKNNTDKQSICYYYKGIISRLTSEIAFLKMLLKQMLG